MEKNTHVELIKNHLEEKESITSLEAIKLYGNTRLSATIYTLRHAYGMRIINKPQHCKNRYGKKTSYVEYVLIRDEQ